MTVSPVLGLASLVGLCALASLSSCTVMPGAGTKLVIVGDIHGHWDYAADADAIRSLTPDAVLFVGDFENEGISIAKSVAELARQLPVAAVLGNHDAWHTTVRGGDGSTVRAQLEQLGEAHVGFGRRDLPSLGLSVVGGRPCSWGGQEWSALHGRPAALYRQHFANLQSFEESASRIEAATAGAPTKHGLIFLAHNGPTGLGTARTAPVGRDFGGLAGGDHGDPDLTAAVAHAAAEGRSVPLVVFGHMHDVVDGRAGARQMLAVQAKTVYINAAVVPRKRQGAGGMERLFTVVTMNSTATVETVVQLWLGPDHKPVEEVRLYPETSTTGAAVLAARAAGASGAIHWAILLVLAVVVDMVVVNA